MQPGRTTGGAEEWVLGWVPYGDWDYVASMILSLRIHLYEYGTVPTWNFMFCHGRPELAVPYSWAWTWPSLFAYALPPLAAMIAVWVVMTGVGFFSTRALLLRWTGSRLGAALGAAIYVLSGFFANRFNAGHLTFAFYHWIPLLIYLFELAFDRARQGGAVRWPLVGITLTSFLFMSSGLPHPLLHFYPVFLLFFLFRLLRTCRDIGPGAALQAAWGPALAHAIGVFMAAYKLLPVVAWQRQFPRVGVLFESYTPIEVILNTLIFVTDYLSPAKQQPWHVYPAWGYNAFVGPVPWLLAGVTIAAALAVWLRSARSDPSRRSDRYGATLFGAILLVVGIALSMGNDNLASPAYLFRHLPIFDGIRAFNRYQGILVFGLAILAAQGSARLATWLQGWPRHYRQLAAGVVVLGTLLPLGVQGVSLVRSIPTHSYGDLLTRYRLPEPDGAPQLIRTRYVRNRAAGHQTAILQQGSWIGRCHANITLPAAFPGRLDPVVGLTAPPPIAVADLHHDRISLRHAPGDSEPIRLHLRMLEGFSLDAVSYREDGWVFVGRDGLGEDTFTLTARYPGVGTGRAVSAAALAAAVVFFGVASRRERRAHDQAPISLEDVS